MSLLKRRLLILAAAVAVFLFAMSRLFAINNVVVVSASRSDAITVEALKIINGSLTQSNMILFDDGTFESKLQQTDPVLRSVTIRRHWPHGLTITAVLKQPSLAWSSGNQLYVLDRDGTAISALVGPPTLPVVTDGSNLPVVVGQRVAPAQFVSFASTVVPALAAVGIKVTGLSITDTTLDLTASTAKGYQLIFDTSRPVADEMSDLKSVQTLLVSQKKAPAQYIDLRIAGKAYYK